MNEQQETKFYAAIERYYSTFKVLPYFIGMSHEDEMSDGFIDKLNQAVDNNDPDIDLTDYFPDGRNL